MSDADYIRIGELAERTSTTPQTLRYYEKLGLLGPAQREGRGYRYYSQHTIARLERIALLKSLGLSLEEIADVIDLYFEDASGIKGKRKVVEILREHLRTTTGRIDELEQFRSELLSNIHRLEAIIQEMETEA